MKKPFISLYDCYLQCSSKEEFMETAIKAVGEHGIGELIKEFIEERPNYDLFDMFYSFLNSPTLREYEATKIRNILLRRLEERFGEFVFEEIKEEFMETAIKAVEVEEVSFFGFLELVRH